MLWVKQNEKVLFVLLLAAMGFTFAFGDQISQLMSTGPSAAAIPVGFGIEVDQGELRTKQDRYNTVLRFSRPYFFEEYRFFNQYSVRPRYRTLPSTDGFNTRDLLFYKEVALKEGLRISDEELAARITQIWRIRTATIRAAEAVGDNPQAQQGLDQEIEKIYNALVKGDVWDPQDLARMVKEFARGMRILTFEETLRDLLLIAALDRHVTGAIAVKPQDVYEEYRSRGEKRQFRWLEASVSEDVRKKIAESVTDEEIEKHFEANSFQLTGVPRVKFSWLKASREAYEAEVEKEIKDEDLEKDYQDERHQYLKPGLYPEAQAFSLLSKEDMAKRENAMYQPLAEVKDKVKARHIRKTANSRLSTLKFKLRNRIYPTKLKDGTNRVIGATAASFADVVADTPVATTGSTGWITQAEAEDVLGDLYTGAVKTEIDSFFTEARQNTTLSEAKQKALAREKSVRSTDDDERFEGMRAIDDFFVFFSDVKILGQGQGTITQLRAEVIDGVVNERINDAIAAALEKTVEAAKTTPVDLAALAKTSIEIEVEPVGKTNATFLEVADVGTAFVARGGSIQIDKPPEDADPEEDVDPTTIQQETHPSSRALNEAAFAIEKVGQLDIAKDSEKGRTYLVELTRTKNPDPGRFEQSRKGVERSFVDQRRLDAFQAWRKEAFVNAGIDLAAEETSDES